MIFIETGTGIRLGLEENVTISVYPELVSDAARALARLAKIKVYDKDIEGASQLFRSAADLELSSPQLQLCWGGPFNGQEGRRAIMLDLLRRVAPDAVYETGTFRGISTEWLAQHFSGPIFTCEKENLYFLQAAARLTKFSNIELVLEDSRKFLAEQLEGKKRSPILVYLDAHWELDLPLREELQIIMKTQRPAVVVIDDFAVPDDSAYLFDNYGPGKRLDVSLLSDVLPSSTQVYFPTLRADEETGARRGCCVITLNGVEGVEFCAVLRGAPLENWLCVATADPNGKVREEDSSDEPKTANGEAYVLANMLEREKFLSQIHWLTAELENLVPRYTEMERAATERLALINQLSAEITELQKTRIEAKAFNEKLRADILRLVEEPGSLQPENIEGQAHLTLLASESATQLSPLEQEGATIDELKGRIARLDAQANALYLSLKTLHSAKKRAENLAAERLAQLEKTRAAMEASIADVKLRSAEFDRAAYERLEIANRQAANYTSLRRKYEQVERLAAERLAGIAALSDELQASRLAQREFAATAARRAATAAHLTADLAAMRGALNALISEGEEEQNYHGLPAVVRLVYRHFLGREAGPHEVENNLATLRRGRPLDAFISEVETSEEARNRNAPFAAIAQLSDGEFIMLIAEILFVSGGANPPELEAYKMHLNETPERRNELILRLVGDYIERARLTEQKPHHDPDRCWIMGTTKFITSKDWNARATEITFPPVSNLPPLREREFKHSGEYITSAIASLYKGRKFLERFLDNVTSQTFFDRSELIIIDANSPEGESDLIEEFCKVYPNIVYKRMNYQIGIYDAWNQGVGLARGRYLTNTNLDDLRRRDSLEVQAKALDAHPFADVVYQDFFYSFDATLDFETIAEFGFKSDLPIVTANNLLCFNSPHNAPMWRATLHKDLGLFDISYKSAGDYEFWLKCALNGRKFLKINEPHVVYFQNPEGISTAPDSPGVVEAQRLRRLYARKLISPYLRMSRQEFADEIGLEPDWNWNEPAFAVVNRALRKLPKRF